MGVVFQARDPRLDRQVAIKLLPPALAADRQAQERLRREARAVAALDHPYICKIFEVGEERDAVFLVMEYVTGETLDHRLRKGRMPLPETLRLAGEIAEALQEAHERGILHRDLKPSNIMLTQQGHVKVMDFGLAKRVGDLPQAGDATRDLTSPQLTAPGTILGTPDYMSPEQLKGLPLDVRSDLFSFGVVLAEMAGARHPFRKPSTVETLSAVLRDPPDLNNDIPQGMTLLLQRLLAKSAEDRYGSAADVRASLGGLAASLRGRRSEQDQHRRIPCAEMAGGGRSSNLHRIGSVSGYPFRVVAPGPRGPGRKSFLPPSGPLPCFHSTITRATPARIISPRE